MVKSNKKENQIANLAGPNVVLQTIGSMVNFNDNGIPRGAKNIGRVRMVQRGNIARIDSENFIADAKLALTSSRSVWLDDAHENASGILGAERANNVEAISVLALFERDCTLGHLHKSEDMKHE